MHNKFVIAISAMVAIMVSPVYAQTPAAQPPGTSSAAPASQQNPVTKTQQINDWILTCRKVDASQQGVQSCEIVQTVIVNGQKAPFAQIAIGKPKAEMPIQITVLVPQNVSFPSVVKVMVDDKDKSPTELAWARCLPVGCFANANLKDDVQKKLSALETQGRVIFKAGNGQDIVMPISFKGLKGALEALAKEK